MPTATAPVPASQHSDTPSKTDVPVAQLFVALPHNAQPGQGSLPHWMPSSRTFRPCAMCSGIQEPTERNGKTGLWCSQCQFFTEVPAAE